MGMMRNGKNITRVVVALVALVVLLGSAAQCHAQRQWNVWHFGTGAGLDFNSGEPVAVQGGAVDQLEGVASYADPQTGALLFYSDGQHVWTKDHSIMYDGWDLGGSPSSTQSALIVPWPGIDSVYFLFTIGQSSVHEGVHYTDYDPTLRCAVVDLRFDDDDREAENALIEGGKVAVKNVVIAHGLGEKLTAIRHADGCRIWLLAHGEMDRKFYAWLIDETGIHDPVISDIGSRIGSIGYMKSSPQGDLIAIASTPGGGQIFADAETQLCRFNRITGDLYDPLPLGLSDAYGVAFSPDGGTLYIEHTADVRDGDTISQFDLSVYEVVTIRASRVVIASIANDTITYVDNTLYYGALQLAPDGKIYVARPKLQAIDVIDNPNEKGASCGYKERAIRFGNGVRVRLGLPNIIDSDLFAAPPSCKAVENPPPHLLEPPRPSPADERAEVSFRLGTASDVRLTLHDALGREIRVLMREYVPFTDRTIVPVSTAGLASGVYYVRLSVGEWRDVKRVVVRH